MAKRLPPQALSENTREDGSEPDRCQVCGGPVVIEDSGRAERYPRRRKCLWCDVEYATTRPAVRNY